MALANAYEWRLDRPHPPVDADVFGAQVELIEREQGRASPRAILDAIKDPSNPMHRAMPDAWWDDRRMADRARVADIRGWVRALVVVEPDESEHAAFVSIRLDRDDEAEGDEGGRGYASLARVLSDDQLYAQALASVVARLRAIRHDHDELIELKSVWDEVDRLDEPE